MDMEDGLLGSYKVTIMNYRKNLPNNEHKKVDFWTEINFL